jgi:hypothetical protein
VERLECVSDQGKLVRPVSIDRGLADTGTGGDRFDPERAVAKLAELIERGLENDLAGTLDSGYLFETFTYRCETLTFYSGRTSETRRIPHGHRECPLHRE